MRGRSMPISPARRLVIDFMRLSQDIPLVSVQRRMHLERAVRARSQCAERPSWMAIFTKAYGVVSEQFPELRRAYVKLPWPRFYEYEKPVALLPLGIDYRSEESIFTIRIGNPGKMRLADVDRTIVAAKTSPVEKVAEFRRLLLVSRLPLPIRYPLQWVSIKSRRAAGQLFRHISDRRRFRTRNRKPAHAVAGLQQPILRRDLTKWRCQRPHVLGSSRDGWRGRRQGARPIGANAQREIADELRDATARSA